MSLGAVGTNATSEFFEELTYQTAYDLARDNLASHLASVDDGVVRDALESAGNVLVMGVTMLMIQKQEQAIELVFNRVYSVVAALLLPVGDWVKGKLRGRKGMKLVRKMLFIDSQASDRIAVAQIASDQIRNHSTSSSSSHSATDTLGNSIAMRDHLVNRESMSISLADAKARRYVSSLMFKMFTQNFTQSDKTMLKRILGRDLTGDIDVEEINKIGSFLFVRDTSGNITGLSEQFFQMLNGLGYTHNRSL